jgi:hypothetical protein
MPLKEWRTFPAPGFELLVRRFTRLGRLTEFAVVLVYFGECITRYDNEHDVPHRDVLGKIAGLMRKEWYENKSNGEAFEYALNDLKENCERFRAFYYAN